MIEKPLPRGSGIDRAAKRERGSKARGRGGLAPAGAVRLNRRLPSPGSGIGPRQPGAVPARGTFISNGTPTLATKPIPWANLPHPLWLGISVKMSGAEPVLSAAVRCAPLQKDGLGL